MTTPIGRLRMLALFTVIGASILSCHVTEPEASPLQDHSFADTCTKGVDAFRATTHQLTRGKCATCHGSEGPGPSFAVEDASQSYLMVKNYVNFADIAHSYFVERAGNGHCRGCGATAAEMAASLTQWWTDGENQCPSIAKYFTTAIPVPARLPTEPGVFSTLRWDLGAIRTEFAGTTFELEAQQFSQASGNIRGAYRFRRPRLRGGNLTLHAAELHVLVNGKMDVSARNYSIIDATVSPQYVESSNPNLPPTPYATFSTDDLIVLQDSNTTGDMLTIGFGELQTATPVTCRNLPRFESDVLPLVSARNCYSCHGGGPQNLNGIYPANHGLTLMGYTSAQICSAFLQRSNKNYPRFSPIIRMPLGAWSDHPQIFSSFSEVSPSWEEWITSEFTTR